jgi:hypothetical protein
MAHKRVKDKQRQPTVLRVELTNPDQNGPMVGFYGAAQRREKKRCRRICV